LELEALSGRATVSGNTWPAPPTPAEAQAASCGAWIRQAGRSAHDSFVAAQALADSEHVERRKRSPANCAVYCVEESDKRSEKSIPVMPITVPMAHAPMSSRVGLLSS
jgi:hypothetical protein